MGFRITVDRDCSHELERHVILGRKTMTNLDNVLESRGIILPTKVCIVRAMVFPVVVWFWELDHKEGWVPKNRCFQIVVLERLLRVPWITRRSYQSILKEVNREHLLEELILKLKLKYFGHLMQLAKSLEKTLILGKTEGRRRRGWQRMRCWMTSSTQWTWVRATLGDSEGQGSLVCCSPWGRKESDTTERLNWTEVKTLASGFLYSSVYMILSNTPVFQSNSPAFLLPRLFTCLLLPLTVISSLRWQWVVCLPYNVFKEFSLHNSSLWEFWIRWCKGKYPESLPQGALRYVKMDKPNSLRTRFPLLFHKLGTSVP